ncbi:MAG: DEAD/DEAH box helicase [Myxococcales bacterium]|nr:DEAD/DEAH box helicase [Myxococcales bacterium]
MSTFSDLGLAEPLVRAVTDLGYDTPTPIQDQAIPHVLEERDLLASAQTGTGKTAAFGLPLLQLLADPRRRPVPGRPRALILTPTRELAIQIDESLREYGTHLRLRHACIFGGVSQKAQVNALSRGLDVLTATPGRLLDLHGQGHVDFDQVERFVLDEADRMLDMGFLPDVRRVIGRLPTERHSLFFSATMPPDIVRLSQQILTDPVHVEIVPESTTAEGITQRVMFVDSAGKKQLVLEVARDERVQRALVFTRTKHRANRLVKLLDRAGVSSAAIHGNKSQNARQRALGAFRAGELPILVATDIAARGIDVEGITHVINYDVPVEPEAYVHRIGRTARAGARGLALTFCDTEELPYLRAIESVIGQRVPVAGDRIGLPPEELEPGPVGQRRRPSRSAGPKGPGKPKPRRRRRRGGGGRSGASA